LEECRLSSESLFLIFIQLFYIIYIIRVSKGLHIHKECSKAILGTLKGIIITVRGQNASRPLGL